MFKEKREVSTITKVLVTMLIIVSVLAVAMILLPKLSRKIVEINVKESEGMVQNYATTEENSWDVSKNGDGSVTAILSDDGTLTISGTGDMKDWSSSSSTDWHNSEIKANVKNVVINEGVTSIGIDGFYECRSLTSIKMPEGVTSIGGYAFYGCSSLTSISIPRGVTSIENSTFENCISLISINIPEGVTDIKSDVFERCDSLRKIKVDVNNKKYMDDNGVLYSKDKKEIEKYPPQKEGKQYTILEGTTNIGWGAFDRCRSLTNIEIPSSVTSIGSYAFSGCSGLTSIDIPEGVTSIGNYVFRGCSSLASITIPRSVTSIRQGAFDNCSSLASINIPEGVTSIASHAFWGCSSLTSIEIPSSVISIGDYAFSGCSSLINIDIPSSVKNIGNYVFSGCQINKWINRGEKIELPNLLKRTQNEEDVLYTSKGFTLENCILEGTNIVIDENETYAKVTVYGGLLGGLAYLISYNEWDISKDGDGSVVATLTDEGTLNIYGTGNMKDWTWENGDAPNWYDSGFDKKIKKVNISNGVTNIGRNAFRYCRNLIDIEIPNSVKSIGSYAFDGCSSLTSIEILEEVSTIGDSTFKGCTSLVEIKIPEGVTSIGNFAFDGCTSLESINISKGVKSIGVRIFEDCSSLREIKVHEDNPNFIDEDGILYTKSKNKIIRYPEGKEEIEYTILEKTTSIGDSAFKGCSSLTSVNIPEGVTSIGDSAFSGCSSLTSINIPEGVTSIGDRTFSGCSNLIIICKNETMAVTYAKENQIRYQIDDNGPTVNFSTNGTDSSVKVLETKITVEDELARVNEHSLKYLWSTQNENITKEEIVNSLQNGEILKIKDVTGTYYLWIYAKDNLGNESVVRSKAFILDNTQPTTNISYSTTGPTNQNVRVTITANEDVQEVEGWILSADKKVLIKEYSDNKTETIKIKDIAGNETPVEVKITNIDKTAPTTEISYSTTAKTNQNVRVTITANEDVQEVEGWTLSADKKVLTKDYTQNKTETIKIKDIAGNETPVEVKITNIDKTAPTAEITYSTTELTNQNVKVTITANEEIQQVSGWTLSTDKKVLTKDYTQNLTETITIKDIFGNESIVQIKVTGIIKFKEETYNIDGTYIIGIQPKTTYENFIKNIVTNSEYKVTEDKEEITENMLIKTGQKLIMDDKSVTLVVIGDANGDGQADLRDILAINKHRLNKAQLENEYLQAGDINEDKKVDLRDILQINKYRLGKISEL